MSLTETKNLSVIDLFLNQLEEEAATTRRMLAIVPNDKYDWQPHSKSMTIKQLTTHIGELPSWISFALQTEELDFAANPYEQIDITNTTDLLSYFERSYKEGKGALEKATEEQLLKTWTMRNGDHIISVRSKADVIRMSLSQLIHHRAQLGVFLRLLNVPLPGSYGPTADEPKF